MKKSLIFVSIISSLLFAFNNINNSYLIKEAKKKYNKEKNDFSIKKIILSKLSNETILKGLEKKYPKEKFPIKQKFLNSILIIKSLEIDKKNKEIIINIDYFNLLKKEGYKDYINSIIFKKLKDKTLNEDKEYFKIKNIANICSNILVKEILNKNISFNYKYNCFIQNKNDKNKKIKLGSFNILINKNICKKYIWN